MAVETTIKTIGSSGRTYSVLQTWEDGAPANLTTAERWSAGTFTGTFTQGETVTGTGLTTGKFLDSDGSSYVTFGIVTGNSNTLVTLTGSTSGATCVVSAKTFTGIIWQGQTYNDSNSFVGDAILTISGSTAGVGTYKELTTGSGQSFQDNASVRTNLLDYNQSKGVGISSSGAYQTMVSVTENYVRISKIQFQTSNAASAFTMRVGNSTTGHILKDCIIRSASRIITADGTSTWINCVFITNSDNKVVMEGGSGHNIIGCTAVRTTNNTAAGTAFNLNSGTTALLTSCAVFGFTTIYAGSTFSASSKNNATQLASGLPGSSNQHSVTFNGTTPFSQASNASTNIQAVASTSLASNGFYDSSNAPNDISNTARNSSTPTIGAWELVAAGGSSRKTTDGLAQASVKTENGLAEASVKSRNGLQ